MRINNFSRRQLLIGGAATAATAVGSAAIWNLIRQHRSEFSSLSYGPATKIILGTTDDHTVSLNDGTRTYTARQKGEIVDFDLRTNKSRRLAVPIWPHGFCFSEKTDLICCVQKWGDLAAVARRDDLSLVKVLTAPHDITYSGHSQFLQDGKFLAITGENHDNQNFIFLHDVAQDFKIVKKFPAPNRIHEIRMLDDRYALLPIMNQQQKVTESGLQLFDFQTGVFDHVLKSTVMAHILPLGDDRYITHGRTSGEAELSVALMDWSKQTVVAMSQSQDNVVHRMSGEALSSGRIDTNHVVLTAPDCGHIVVWNFETNRVVAYTNGVDVPLGVKVCADGSFIINQKSKELRRFRFDAKANRIEPLEVLFDNVGNGRHLYVFNDASTR